MLHFSWDEAKAKANLRKHKISFELASLFVLDPYHLTEFNRSVTGEDRYNTLAKIDKTIIFVVHCYRKNKYGEEIIRIISARKAETREAARYYRQTSL